MIKDELVSFETAKLAKEKRFKALTERYYHISSTGKLESACGMDDWNSYKKALAAPTQSLLQRWLREVHKIHVEIILIDNTKNYYWEAVLTDSKNRSYDDFSFMDCAKEIDLDVKANTYEQALEKGLFEALKLIK